VDQLLSTVAFILIYGVSYGMVLFTVSVGLVVTMGLMRVANMAHGAFAAIGGYISITIANDYGVPLWASAVVGILGTGLLAIVIERLLFVGLYTAPELDQVLMTIGLAFLTVAGLNLVFGPNPIPSHLPAFLLANVNLGVRYVQAYRVALVGFGLALMIALWFIFDRTGFGARIRAAVDNRGMAQAVGINVNKLFTKAFVLGCALAALGGTVGVALLPLEPQYVFKYLVLLLVVVSLSGFGNIKASAQISLLVGVVDTAARYLFPSLGAFVVYFVLIGLMVWRDQGPFASGTR
jgi:branched-chain amino acid transport system permease protein